jgi:conjugal transfer mating pair stabilization protein TraN
MRRCAHLVALVLLVAGFGVPVSAQMPVFIPEPVDPAEPIIMEPDIDPAYPATGTLPPPFPAAPMTQAEAKAEAKATGKTLREAYRDLPLAEGAAGQIPHYQDGTPAEAGYFDNPDAMPGDGLIAGLSNEGYQTANNPDRPVASVTASDVARAVAVEDDPQGYLGGEDLAGVQGSCVPLPPGGGGTTSAEWTCNIGAAVVETPQSCTRTLNVEAWNATAYQYLCVKGSGFDYCSALAGSSVCRKTSSVEVAGYGLVIDTYDCSDTVTDPNIYLYGTTSLPPPAGAFEVTEAVYRCNAQGLTEAFSVDPLTGSLIGSESGLGACSQFEANTQCAATSASAAGIAERSLCKRLEFSGDSFGLGGALICAEYAEPESIYRCSQSIPGANPERLTSRWFTESWTESPCAAAASDCRFVDDICTSTPNETRLIDGVAVTRPCWDYAKRYQCQTVVGGGNDCGSLEANGSCTLDREICLDDPQTGACQVSERVYRCALPGSAPEPPQYICGDDVYCINGDCEPIEREASTEFKDAVVALNALGQANSEFDENSLTLFRGTRATCHKKVFGLSNCCSGKGAPLLTPFLCSAAERQLDEKDDKGLCHKIGTYCSDRVLGVCVTRKDAYCCYQSKISRILQEQGRPQIGKAWGAPKTESCAGFSIYEFQQLDLSVMDFSEVYAEFQDAARLPDEAAALVDIQTKIEAYYASH